MTKLQLPCVVCASIIYADANIDQATVVCVDCRLQGKGPKMQRVRHCSKCGCAITAANTHPRTKKCAPCYLEWHRVNEERKAQREQEQEAKAKEAALVPMYASYDDMTSPDTAVFGGLPWLHAAVNPVE